MPNLVGSLLRLPYTFAVPKFGGRNWTVASALLLLESRTEPPDVVMVDLDMPGMDGIEFIGHLAQRSLARSVLVVSALDPALLNTVQTMARAYGLHVLGSVEKPLTLENLSQALARHHTRTAAHADEESGEITASMVRTARPAHRSTSAGPPWPASSTQAPRKVFMVRCASGVTRMRQRAVAGPSVSGGVAKCTPKARRSWAKTWPSSSFRTLPI